MDHHQRHAYLIMAHHNFGQLKILVDLLDDPRNDIYIHIDKKSSTFDPDTITTKHAALYFVPPMSVTWGGHRQIMCEMNLFRNAAPKHYMYYHLLSGVDLPIKTQDEIHAFFREHAGQNFMEIDQNAMATGSFLSRVKYYYLFQNILGKNMITENPPPVMRLIRKAQTLFVLIQQLIHYQRKEWIPYYKGANWVSITDDLLQYVLTSEKTIKKMFYYTIAADEVFLQTIAMSSPYRDTIVENYYREIDWSDGFPHIYRKEDIPQLLRSPAFFARKFDMTVDPDAIRLVAAHLTGDTPV